MGSKPQATVKRLGIQTPCLTHKLIETLHSQTHGAGVDLALNSLAGDKLQATVRCIATNGALLELGKYDILQGTRLSMQPMDRNISFHGINLDTLFASPKKLQVLARTCGNLFTRNPALRACALMPCVLMLEPSGDAGWLQRAFWCTLAIPA